MIMATFGACNPSNIFRPLRLWNLNDFFLKKIITFLANQNQGTDISSLEVLSEYGVFLSGL